ncbi:flagellar basal body P-ring formation chaperone FlgA [Chthonobacter rhizosphaerae]|uniref:flagellar basal body P-ring formation chaperone FlgA n=1 Tax=Chthonobacter rhizosphaerae TaxID=2735553 RepID=UPI0015EEDA04|nr:flagellar basal body P-ring formation chaperone FlgA [Chthonobacter rhizosphaerae]
MTRVFFTRLAIATLIAMLLAAAISIRPAAAEGLLKREVTVAGDVVTLGDLFDGAGPLAGTPVFQAPDPGVDGELPVEDAVEAARRVGLPIVYPRFATVRVMRPATTIDAATFERLVRDAAAARIAARPDDVAVTFEGLVDTIAADASSASPAVLAAFALQSGTGRFSAKVTVDVGAASRTVDLSGTAVETVELPVVTRPLARGAILSAADVTLERVDRRRVARGALTDLDQAVGMAARRPLRAGDTLAANDLDSPRLVSRNELVTLLYQKPGLTLSARGRALSDGASGSLVSVLNEQSKRVVQGVVTAPGVVQVTTSASRLASVGVASP